VLNQWNWNYRFDSAVKRWSVELDTADALAVGAGARAGIIAETRCVNVIALAT